MHNIFKLTHHHNINLVWKNKLNKWHNFKKIERLNFTRTNCKCIKFIKRYLIIFLGYIYFFYCFYVSNYKLNITLEVFRLIKKLSLTISKPYKMSIEKRPFTKSFIKWKVKIIENSFHRSMRNTCKILK